MERLRFTSTCVAATSSKKSFHRRYRNWNGHRPKLLFTFRRTFPSLHVCSIILILHYSFIATCSELEPPEIFPSVTGIFPIINTPLNLTCIGDRPLLWNHSNINLGTDTRVKIINGEGNSSRNYSSTLIIDNVHPRDGGYITCAYEECHETPSEEHNCEDIKPIFPKVDSGRVVLMNTFLGCIRSEVGNIPCVPLPQWTDVVKIELKHDSKIIRLTDNNYSKKQGYKIDNSTNGFGHYECIGTFNDVLDHQLVQLCPKDNPVHSPYVTLPVIETPKGTAIRLGDDLEVLCKTSQLIHHTFDMYITGPFSPNDPRVDYDHGTDAEAHYGKSPKHKTWQRKLVIHGASKNDSGNYVCSVEVFFHGNNSWRNTSRQIQVFDRGEEFLNVTSTRKSIRVVEGISAKWIINIQGFPSNFSTILKNPKGKILNTNSSKYKLVETLVSTQNAVHNQYKLEISDVTLQDNGSYPLTVSLLGYYVPPVTLMLNLFVSAPPNVTITPKSSTNNCMVNTSCELKCIARGNPPPTVHWTFQECESITECNVPENVKETSINTVEFDTISTINFHAVAHGKYTCYANNSAKVFNTSTFMRVVDFPGSSQISIIKPEEIVEGDNVEIVCAVSKLSNKTNITWEKVEGDNKAKLKFEETDWSYRRKLSFDNIKMYSEGRYQCIGVGASGKEHLEAELSLNVIASSPPHITETNLNGSKSVLKLGNGLNLSCNAEGKPNPMINWTWEDLPPEHWPNDLKYAIVNKGTKLELKYVPTDAEGRFKCTANNRNGNETRFLDLSVTGSQMFSKLAVAIILLLVFAVIIFGAFLAHFKYKQGELNRFLKEISQKDFYDGAVENINPDLSVTDQAYLLPFDTRWEFPKDRLKFGMQLGSGAFGRVVKADAIGILDSEPITTVAVKMVKPNADESHFKALMSELKIMVHLGKHINVVNLLGACTKNLAKKKELFVIVEYCKYGSLLSYMHRHKRTFVNQLDPARGIIDTKIDWQSNRNSAQSQARQIHYAQLTFTDAGNSRPPASNGYRTLDEFKEPIVDGPPGTPTLQPYDPDYRSRNDGYFHNRNSTEHYVPESQVESVCTGISYLSNGPTTDGTTNRSSSCGHWQDHYRGDYQARDVMPINTSDLICWAFQIARGMDYLASRKVLHGDLAARNVLLTENNVVKICDFGLAKEMYKDYKYKKKSEGVLLPVKWMAIESIYYGLFSTQSDCWSFGVVLWELFTLGKTPYPGMDADDRFYKRIMEGYRMEKPLYAPSCVYDIMLECWAQEATERPSFSALADRIGDMMEEGRRNHYVDLNSVYMKINQTYMEGKPDYLRQMGRSDFTTNSARPSPERQYQNVPEELDNSGYLKPIPPTLSSPSTVSPSNPSLKYQNLPKTMNKPTRTMLANNSAYHSCAFIKSPDEKLNTDEELGENSSLEPKCTIQIRYSPDIKDIYGLREDSTSPDRNSLSDINDINVLDESRFGGPVNLGDRVPNAIDNINYVPFPFNVKPISKSDSNSTKAVTDNCKENEISESKSAKKQKRQKNDSGLGSIDSTQLENHHKLVNSEDHQDYNNDLDSLQQPNGYISHKYVTS